MLGSERHQIPNLQWLTSLDQSPQELPTLTEAHGINFDDATRRKLLHMLEILADLSDVLDDVAKHAAIPVLTQGSTKRDEVDVETWVGLLER